MSSGSALSRLYLAYISPISPQEEAAREQRERASSSEGAREEALAEATGRAEGLEELLQAERSALVALRAQHGTLQEEAQRLQAEI